MATGRAPGLRPEPAHKGRREEACAGGGAAGGCAGRAFAMVALRAAGGGAATRARGRRALPGRLRPLPVQDLPKSASKTGIV